jgi:two-component system OmpR family response regulator
MDRAKRILIVEDDPHISELLRMHLSDEGFAVVQAADGSWRPAPGMRWYWT